MKIRIDETNIVETPSLAILDTSHENKWVALSSDYKKILAVGDRLMDVLHVKEVDKVVLKVLPQLGYAPSAV